MSETSIFSPVSRTDKTESQTLLVPEDKQLPSDFEVPKVGVEPYLQQLSERNGLHSCHPSSMLNGLIHLGIVSSEAAQAFQGTFQDENKDLFSQREINGEQIMVVSAAAGVVAEKMKQDMKVEFAIDVVDIADSDVATVRRAIMNLVVEGNVIVGGDSDHAVLVYGYSDEGSKLKVIDGNSPTETKQISSEEFIKQAISGEPWLTILGTTQEVNDKPSSLTETIASLPEYQELLEEWSQEDVETYLHQIAPEHANSTIQEAFSSTPTGMAVAYHERYELRQLEKLIDERMGAGTFRRRLAEQTLEEIEYYEYEENGRHYRKYYYSVAHPMAMRAEVELLRKAAETHGHSFSPLAIYLAKPNTWEEFENTSRSVEGVYQMQRSGNLGQADEMFPEEVPADLEDQVLRAEQFFVENGSGGGYPIKPSEIIRKNGFKKLSS